MRLAIQILYYEFDPDCEFNRFSLVRGHPVGTLNELISGAFTLNFFVPYL